MTVESLPLFRLAGRTIPPSLFSIIRVKLVLGRKRIYWAFVLRPSQKDDACKLWATRADLSDHFYQFGTRFSCLSPLHAALNPYGAAPFRVVEQFVCSAFWQVSAVGQAASPDFIPSHVVFALPSPSRNVARIVSNKSSSLNGLPRKATAPACNAC